MTWDTYRTFLFDCDGVVLNSNTLKSDAFYQTALPFGEKVAKEFLQHHLENGGISRYEKFDYLQDTVLPKHNKNTTNITTATLLNDYATRVREGLINCEISPGLEQLRTMVSDTKWCVVSGGDQNELRTLFKARKIDNMFDGGIFGSPDNKFEILEREFKNNNFKAPALFLGDSKLDHQAAAAFDIDFIFLSKWTEVNDWEAYCQERNLKTVQSIRCLLESFLL